MACDAYGGRRKPLVVPLGPTSARELNKSKWQRAEWACAAKRRRMGRLTSGPTPDHRLPRSLGAARCRWRPSAFQVEARAPSSLSLAPPRSRCSWAGARIIKRPCSANGFVSFLPAAQSRRAKCSLVHSCLSAPLKFAVQIQTMTQLLSRNFHLGPSRALNSARQKHADAARVHFSRSRDEKKDPISACRRRRAGA